MNIFSDSNSIFNSLTPPFIIIVVVLIHSFVNQTRKKAEKRKVLRGANLMICNTYANWIQLDDCRTRESSKSLSNSNL